MPLLTFWCAIPIVRHYTTIYVYKDINFYTKTSQLYAMYHANWHQQMIWHETKNTFILHYQMIRELGSVKQATGNKEIASIMK